MIDSVEMIAGTLVYYVTKCAKLIEFIPAIFNCVTELKLLQRITASDSIRLGHLIRSRSGISPPLYDSFHAIVGLHAKYFESTTLFLSEMKL